MKNRSLLINILHALLQEWGHAEIEAALSEISDVQVNRSGSGRKASPRKQPTKLRAVEQVERSNPPEALRPFLIELASRFDKKEFLPSTSDVREFLLMLGQRPGAMKDRSEAFRKLLQILSALPPDRLEKVAATALNTGPSQLGPLSDAISSTAETLIPSRGGRWANPKG